jgi:hypothetical protein
MTLSSAPGPRACPGCHLPLKPKLHHHVESIALLRAQLAEERRAASRSDSRPDGQGWNVAGAVLEFLLTIAS